MGQSPEAGGANVTLKKPIGIRRGRELVLVSEFSSNFPVSSIRILASGSGDPTVKEFDYVSKLDLSI
ncbi:MAG TPA: hypothetical protein V6D14_14230 [Coleofasciculaceae cyanobacterium]